MARPPLVPFTLVSMAALAACNRSESTNAAPSASATAATAPAAPAPGGAAAVAPAGSCPAGKWEYDYADQFLETLARNSSGARVVSERGKYICTFNGNERGSYVCETSEGGVENVFEAPTAGMALKITIKMNGRSSADYEPAGPGRWKTTRADMSGLRVETKATLAGRDMPVPATNAFSGMDRPGTIFEVRCEGDVLKLKPIVEGMTTDFITMKRVP
ncbi:hypothetical protein [Sorangium sp. So ce1000]|uniref:hypothetical protein n=1 Tax=Sorangium sp. So ce1000 TaxID=3133325 RepID=UPI003F5E6E41